MTETQDGLLIGQDSTGRLVHRPMSPHLQVYRPQLTSILSIMNRVTGIALSVGTALLVWWLVAAASGPVAFDRVQWFIGSPVGLFMLFGWTAALFYHLYGGIRHLVWDTGRGLAKPGLNPMTWVILGLTAVSTLAVWVFGYIALVAA